MADGAFLHQSHPDASVVASFAAGKLADDQHRRIRAHLATCETCRAVYNSLRQAADSSLGPNANTVCDHESPPHPTDADATAIQATDMARIDHNATAAWRQGTSPTADEEATLASGPASPSRVPRPPESGRFGGYELIAEIATGGMGIVYQARQVKLNRVVALKMMKAGTFPSADDVERFYTEAEAAAGLSHPGIVPIYEVGDHAGQHYFSMAYVQGQSLDQRIAGTPLPPRDAAQLMKQIAEAIAYAHQQGVIHRDLKPANVLLDAEGRPQVADFGLAKNLLIESGLTQTGTVMGTPSYMPPEQATGDVAAIGPGSDVYSLGAILYCMLTGRPPFRAATPIETLRQVVDQEPVSPRHLNPATPQDLETICLKCLAKEPHQRYSSAQALADELDRFLRDEPIQARPIGPAGRTWRWCKRNPAVATLAASVLVVLLAGIGVSSYFAHIANQQAQEAQAAAKLAEDRAAAEQQATQRAEREKLRADEAAQQAAARALAEQQAKEEALLAQQHAEQHRQLAESRLYASSMMRAQREWELNDVAAAQSVLAQCPPHLRNLEFHLLSRLLDQSLKTYVGHPSMVLDVAFSPSGEHLLTADYQGGIKLWNASTGEALLTVDGRADAVNSVAFSPAGEHFLSGNADGTAKLWWVSGNALVTFKGHTAPVLDVAFSPDGKTVLTASADHTVRIWDATTGEVLRVLTDHTDQVTCVAYSPDGKRIATASWDTTAKVWDAETGQVLLTLAGHRYSVNAVAFSPDGKRLLTGGRDGTARLWDATSGEALRSIATGTAYVRCVAFSPDGNYLLTAGGDFVRAANSSFAGEATIWDANTGEQISTLQGHKHHIAGAAFSPDGNWILTGSHDKTIKLWATRVRHQPRTIDAYACPVTAVFSPDGKRLLSGRGRCLDNASPSPSQAPITLWDLASGEALLSLDGHDRHITSVAFSPDGMRFLTGSADHTAKLWDATTGEELLTLSGHAGGINEVAFGPQGRYLLTGSEDQTAKLWDATTGEERLTFSGHSDAVYAVAISPDGTRILTGSRDRTAKLWDAVSGEELLASPGHGNPVRTADFSPDGRRFLTGDNIGKIHFWDTSTGEELKIINGHLDYISTAAFSPDGKRLLTGSGDKTVRIWDAETGVELLVLKDHVQGVVSATFSPDGQRILTGDGNGTIRIWDGSQRTDGVITPTP